MKFRLAPLLRIAGLITVVAFGASAALRNARHGIALVAGDVAWFTFIAAALAVVVLGAAATIVALGQRVHQKPAR